MGLVYRRLSRILPGQHLCPVCDAKIPHFLPLPEHYQFYMLKYGFRHSLENMETLNVNMYSCPICGASDRDRLSALFISNFFTGQFLVPEAILEIAPSKPLTAFLRRIDKINLRTADLFMEGVDDRVDIADMSCYGDGIFDGFICSHVLEHVPNDRQALRELYRILKPGGWGILMVPILLGTDEVDEDPSIEDSAERWKRFGQHDHIRLYSKPGFLERVTTTGFLVHQYGRDYFGNRLLRLCGISKGSILYVVEKI